MAAQDERTPEERMADHLKESTLRVKQQGLMMKRALDREDRDDALKFAEEMLSTLNTADLSPKMYYDLYHSNFDQLRHLEEYFLQEWHNGSSIFDLYERVQHTNQILPRLYLLVTVGSVYIRSKEAPAKDVLKDLVEMCRGIQHPLRGLFLRQYLSQMSKDKLPDVGSEYEGQGGRVTDSIDFTLLNFTEMNKLWVRMQHQGHTRDKAQREKERRELRILVGTNLVRISSLEGVTSEMYKDVSVCARRGVLSAAPSHVPSSGVDTLVAYFLTRFALFSCPLRVLAENPPGGDAADRRVQGSDRAGVPYGVHHPGFPGRAAPADS